jgi:VIT1/CCC1 family predicted Fe2+/Mn2+ transporter
MTRALAALGRGDAVASVTYHAFAPIVAAAAALAWAALGIGLLTGRDLLPDFNTRGFQIACLAFIAAFVVYWLFRLWRGSAP